MAGIPNGVAQGWGHTRFVSAFYVEDVKVGAGHHVYVGRVAPIYQGVLTPRNIPFTRRRASAAIWRLAETRLPSTTHFLHMRNNIQVIKGFEVVLAEFNTQFHL